MVQKQKQPTTPTHIEYSSESDSASGDEWADMLDDEEQQYIMKRLATQPNLLSNVPEKETVQKYGIFISNILCFLTFNRALVA